jgi:hypothetical protein
LEEGDKCFTAGNYICAESKYKELVRISAGKEKQIAEIKLQRAQWCLDHLKTANLAFSNKNYKKAKEDYLSILDSNPEDRYVKSQIDMIDSVSKKPLVATLNLSKTNLSFEATGGSVSISVDTNIEDYEIKLLPSWCSVQKYNKYFVIKCNTATGSAPRNDYFNVVAGNKTVTVKILQQGTAQVQVKDYFLNVSQTNFNLYYDGVTDEKIRVDTNASDFTVTYIPNWITVKKYRGIDLVTYYNIFVSQSFRINHPINQVVKYVLLVN